LYYHFKALKIKLQLSQVQTEVLVTAAERQYKQKS